MRLDKIQEIVMKVRINGEWKEYDVQLVETTGGTAVFCEQLQKDWSLSRMEWIEHIYIRYHHDLNHDVLFGMYTFDGLQASDVLCFQLPLT